MVCVVYDGNELAFCPTTLFMVLWPPRVDRPLQLPIARSHDLLNKPLGSAASEKRIFEAAPQGAINETKNNCIAVNK